MIYDVGGDVVIVGMILFLAGFCVVAWLQSLADRRARRNIVCAYCGRKPIVWPRYFSDSFYERHRCPSGRGHFFFDPSRRARRRGGLVDESVFRRLR